MVVRNIQVGSVDIWTMFGWYYSLYWALKNFYTLESSVSCVFLREKIQW